MNNNDLKDGKPTEQKKKMPPREIIRRVMLAVCVCAFVFFLVQFILVIFQYIEARNVSEEVLQGANEITKPVESEPQNSVPVIVIPETGLPETGTDKENEPDPTPPEHVYSEYFSQWLEFIKESKKKYPDLIGYIEIENLDMLYPIVQSEDNDYYLKHLIDGSKNSRGEIFLDYRNDGVITNNKQWVLYGHNLADGTKFHNLTDLREEEN